MSQIVDNNEDNHHDHHYDDDHDDDDDHDNYQGCEVIEAKCDAGAVLTDVSTPPSLQHLKADMRENIKWIARIT